MKYLRAVLPCLAAATVSAAGRSGRMEEGGGAERIVLFVCTSNTCRSPMAEAIAKHWFAERCGCQLNQLKSHGWDIRSGGLTDEYEKPGSPASANSVIAMKRSGLDLADHRSTLLTRDAIRQAHRILCVSNRHVQWIVSEVPEAANKTSTLGADIPDPWHQEQVAYDHVAETMLAVVPKMCQVAFGDHFVSGKI